MPSPVPGYTSPGTPYGARGSWAAGYHTGEDWGTSGKPIVPIKSGKVVDANWGGAYGIQVIVEEANGNRTLYGHMSSKRVSPGTIVLAGKTVLGYIGCTGRCFGPHVHVEARRPPYRYAADSFRPNYDAPKVPDRIRGDGHRADAVRLAKAMEGHDIIEINKFDGAGSFDRRWDGGFVGFVMFWAGVPPRRANGTRGNWRKGGWNQQHDISIAIDRWQAQGRWYDWYRHNNQPKVGDVVVVKHTDRRSIGVVVGTDHWKQGKSGGYLDVAQGDVNGRVKLVKRYQKNIIGFGRPDYTGVPYKPPVLKQPVRKPGQPEPEVSPAPPDAGSPEAPPSSAGWPMDNVHPANDTLNPPVAPNPPYTGPAVTWDVAGGVALRQMGYHPKNLTEAWENNEYMMYNGQQWWWYPLPADVDPASLPPGVGGRWMPGVKPPEDPVPAGSWDSIGRLIPAWTHKGTQFAAFANLLDDVLARNGWKAPYAPKIQKAGILGDDVDRGVLHYTQPATYRTVLDELFTKAKGIDWWVDEDLVVRGQSPRRIRDRRGPRPIRSGGVAASSHDWSPDPYLQSGFTVGGMGGFWSLNTTWGIASPGHIPAKIQPNGFARLDTADPLPTHGIRMVTLTVRVWVDRPTRINLGAVYGKTASSAGFFQPGSGATTGWNRDIPVGESVITEVVYLPPGQQFMRPWWLVQAPDDLPPGETISIDFREAWVGAHEGSEVDVVIGHHTANYTETTAPEYANVVQGFYISSEDGTVWAKEHSPDNILDTSSLNIGQQLGWGLERALPATGFTVDATTDRSAGVWTAATDTGYGGREFTISGTPQTVVRGGLGTLEVSLSPTVQVAPADWKPTQRGWWADGIVTGATTAALGVSVHPSLAQLWFSPKAGAMSTDVSGQTFSGTSSIPTTANTQTKVNLPAKTPTLRLLLGGSLAGTQWRWRVRSMSGNTVKQEWQGAWGTDTLPALAVPEFVSGSALEVIVEAKAPAGTRLSLTDWLTMENFASGYDIQVSQVGFPYKDPTLGMQVQARVKILDDKNVFYSEQVIPWQAFTPGGTLKDDLSVWMLPGDKVQIDVSVRFATGSATTRHVRMTVGAANVFLRPADVPAPTPKWDTRGRWEASASVSEFSSDASRSNVLVREHYKRQMALPEISFTLFPWLWWDLDLQVGDVINLRIQTYPEDLTTPPGYDPTRLRSVRACRIQEASIGVSESGEEVIDVTAVLENSYTLANPWDPDGDTSTATARTALPARQALAPAEAQESREQGIVWTPVTTPKVIWAGGDVLKVQLPGAVADSNQGAWMQTPFFPVVPGTRLAVAVTCSVLDFPVGTFPGEVDIPQGGLVNADVWLATGIGTSAGNFVMAADDSVVTDNPLLSTQAASYANLPGSDGPALYQGQTQFVVTFQVPDDATAGRLLINASPTVWHTCELTYHHIEVYDPDAEQDAASILRGPERPREVQKVSPIERLIRDLGESG